MKDLTVLMYHYVRDIKNSRYSGIKGLETILFKEQLSYVKKHYNPVTMQQVINAFSAKEKLPPKAVLFTFDDAYKDHYETVFPILFNNGIQGCFFAPVKAVTEHTVLDVNKIHFILESCHDKISDYNHVIEEIQNILDEFRHEYSLQSFEYYFSKLARANRFDPKEVIFIKRLLQVELKEDLRRIITDRLFKEHVLRDEVSEEAFSRELYMNEEQMRTMIKCGMIIGSHGYDHYWLGHLDKGKQDFEIKKSVEFIQSIGGDVENWTIGFPYGSYNKDTIDLLKKYNCKLGFTTEVNLADSSSDDNDAVYKIPRLDTNDLPKDANAVVNNWWNQSI